MLACWWLHRYRFSQKNAGGQIIKLKPEKVKPASGGVGHVYFISLSGVETFIGVSVTGGLRVLKVWESGALQTRLAPFLL